MLIFALLTLALSGRIAAQLNTQLFVAVDIPLTAARGYGNPFLNVSVQATFTCVGCSPSGDWPLTMARSAFWNGSSNWVVRFAPTDIGLWNFTTACTSEACVGDAGLDHVTGTVSAAAYAGSNPLYAHGFVRVPRSSNGSATRYMFHADGTPFFWLGDTHWMAADFEHLSDCNAPDPNCTSIFRTLVDDRVSKGFSVYQTYIHGDTTSWWSDGAPTWELLNPVNFTQRLDVMLQYIIDQGMMPALGIGLHYMSDEMPTASLVSLAQYVSARYGAYPVVWITAQEVNAPNANVTVWHAAAEALAGDDALSYAHPYSTHMWVFENNTSNAEPTIWGTEPWHTYFATQGGHTGMGIRPQSHYQFYWDYSPQQPFLEAEAMYEEIICGPRFAYANDTRIAAYKSLLCGSLGYTYGAAAVWLFRYNMNDTNGEVYNPQTWWWPGMNLPGSTHMSYLAAVLRSLPWWTLTPRFGDPAWCNFTDTEETVLATGGNTLYVLYSYGVGLTLGSLRGMVPAAAYNAAWFDVQTGVYTQLGSVVPDASGDWSIPPKPDVNDWLLVVQAAASSKDE